MEIDEDESRPFDLSPWVTGLLSLAIYMLMIIAKHQFLISQDQLLSEYTGDDFEKYVSATNLFRAFKYVFIALFFLGGILLTFLVLSGANFFLSINLTPKQLLNVSILSSVGDSIQELFIIVWFATGTTFQTTEVFNFYPLSVFSLLTKSEDIIFPASYVLQSLNLFLFIKLFLIGYAYYATTEKGLAQSFRDAFYSYLLPLLGLYGLLYYVV